MVEYITKGENNADFAMTNLHAALNGMGLDGATKNRDKCPTCSTRIIPETTAITKISSDNAKAALPLLLELFNVRHFGKCLDASMTAVINCAIMNALVGLDGQILHTFEVEHTFKRKVLEHLDELMYWTMEGRLPRAAIKEIRKGVTVFLRYFVQEVTREMPVVDVMTKE